MTRVGANKVPVGRTAQHFAFDGSEVYLAYQDYGLDMITAPGNFPSTESPKSLRMSRLSSRRSSRGNLSSFLSEVSTGARSDVINFRTMIRGKEPNYSSHKLSKVYLQNGVSQVRLAMVSDQGRAQICNRSLESFTLENMMVERIVFCGADWIGFIGTRI